MPTLPEKIADILSLPNALPKPGLPFEIRWAVANCASTNQQVLFIRKEISTHLLPPQQDRLLRYKGHYKKEKEVPVIQQTIATSTLPQEVKDFILNPPSIAGANWRWDFKVKMYIYMETKVTMDLEYLFICSIVKEILWA